MIFLHLPEAHALVAKQDLPLPAWLFAARARGLAQIRSEILTIALKPG